MANRKLIQQTYVEHFNHLKDIAREVDQLKKAVQESSDPKTKELLNKHIAILDREIRDYVKSLDSSSTRLMQNAA